MANPFLVDSSHDEIETAILYEKAKITDIGNAIAFTDGNRLYINTEENLERLLPNYNTNMLKWLLWHERYHIDLRHHSRYFKYMKSIYEEHSDDICVTKDEVNIIMDILVHDSLSKMFPELVETAENNYAQMRDRNSLMYTFSTYNLEDMITEYAQFKKDMCGSKGDGDGDSKDSKDSKDDDSKDSKDSKDGDGKDSKDDKKKKTSTSSKSKDDAKTNEQQSSDKSVSQTDDTAKEKAHREGKKTSPDKDKSRKEDGKPEINPEKERPTGRHEEVNWDKLEDINPKEFIEIEEADHIDNQINKLKQKKLKLGKLTQKLNGLATTKRDRTYRLPSMLQMGDGCIFKGKTAGRIELYLVFDASGSMSSEMNMFKDIITKSIPQALNCPCEWFAGYDYEHKCTVKPYKRELCNEYYKGKFKDFLPIRADGGYNDDGDRTIELCWQAEKAGFTPIGVTDGGGSISWSTDKLKELRKTIFVGPNKWWLDYAKEINSHIQTLHVDI